MADTSTQDQIERRLAELPEDVRNAVLSADLGRNVQVIGQAHHLHIDQIGKLEDETMLVMLGFFDPEQFSTQLEQQLLIPAADAAAIASEINSAIFLPIRESLKHFMAERAVAAEEPHLEPSTPAVPATAPAPVMPMVQTTPLAPMAQPPAAPTPVSTTPTPPPAPIMPKADAALTEPTVVKPTYKTDPYREPIE